MKFKRFSRFGIIILGICLAVVVCGVAIVQIDISQARSRSANFCGAVEIGTVIEELKPTLTQHPFDKIILLSDGGDIVGAVSNEVDFLPEVENFSDGTLRVMFNSGSFAVFNCDIVTRGKKVVEANLHEHY